MAQGKKSFLLYCDIQSTIKKLSDENAGKLFKIILSYVNDENPVVDDMLLDLVFEPIKLQLKRDLRRYESIVESRRMAGLASAEKKKQNQQVLTSVDKCQQDATKSTEKDTDTDTVIDIVKDINKENKYTPKNQSKKPETFDFKKSLLSLGVTNQIATDWMTVRKNKKASNTETAFKAIAKQIDLSGLPANECIRIAVERSWQGFKAEWIDNTPKKEIYVHD